MREMHDLQSPVLALQVYYEDCDEKIHPVCSLVALEPEAKVRCYCIFHIFNNPHVYIKLDSLPLNNNQRNIAVKEYLATCSFARADASPTSGPCQGVL